MKAVATIESKALDVKLNGSRKECINIMAGGASRLIVLTDVASMQAGVENSHFSVVNFV